MQNDRPGSDNNSLRKPSWPAWLHRRSIVWTSIAIIVLLLDAILPSAVIDSLYYRKIFVGLRNVYDFLFGWLPFPMIYIIVLFVLVRIVNWFNDWKKGFLFQLSRIVGGIALIVTVFYLSWGLNYKQYRLQDRLGFKLDQVVEKDVELEFTRATRVLQHEASLLTEPYRSDESIQKLKLQDRELRPDVEYALQKLGLPHSGNVNVRQLWPKGFLLRWSTAGIYIPHAFEGHIDPGLLSVQKPFTMAHEMAHGYGLTDEGACNFVAWLACSQSKDQWVRYGGALTYWRYVAAEMPEESVIRALNTFDPVVKRSLQLIRENDKKYPDLMPKIRDAVYASYLRRHGVEGGLRSYNYVVKMVILYLASEPRQ